MTLRCGQRASICQISFLSGLWREMPVVFFPFQHIQLCIWEVPWFLQFVEASAWCTPWFHCAALTSANSCLAEALLSNIWEHLQGFVLRGGFPRKPCFDPRWFADGAGWLQWWVRCRLSGLMPSHVTLDMWPNPFSVKGMVVMPTSQNYDAVKENSVSRTFL